MAPKLELLPTEILEMIANFCVEEPDNKLFNLRATCRKIEAGPSACAVSAANPYGCLVTAISALDNAKCTAHTCPTSSSDAPTALLLAQTSFKGQVSSFRGTAMASQSMHGDISMCMVRFKGLDGDIMCEGPSTGASSKCMCKSKSKSKFRLQTNTTARASTCAHVGRARAGPANLLIDAPDLGFSIKRAF